VNKITDAEEIVKLLDPFCVQYSQFLKEKVSIPFDYGSRFSSEFLKLSNSYFTIKDYENSLKWINLFFDLKTEFGFSIGNDIEKFEKKKLQCLEKLK
jgi:hypothetical protein